MSVGVRLVDTSNFMSIKHNKLNCTEVSRATQTEGGRESGIEVTVAENDNADSL